MNLKGWARYSQVGSIPVAAHGQDSCRTRGSRSQGVGFGLGPTAEEEH